MLRGVQRKYLALLFLLSILVLTIIYYDRLLSRLFPKSNAQLIIQFKMEYYKRSSKTTGPNDVSICLNKVEKGPNAKKSIWTFLSNDNLDYAKSASKLLKSLHINTKTTYPNFTQIFDPIVLEMHEKPLKSQVKQELVNAGWKICTVNRIGPRDEPNTFPRFRDQFTKLVLWNLTKHDYESLVYFDADSLVVSSSISDLLQIDRDQMASDGFKFGATRDIRNGKWLPEFNMGVFVLRITDEFYSGEFEKLMRLKNDPELNFETTMAEQGFLNKVYGNGDWFEIGFENNANLAVYSQRPKYWRERESRINVIHYTMVKPWQSCESTVYAPICAIWSSY